METILEFLNMKTIRTIVTQRTDKKVKFSHHSSDYKGLLIPYCSGSYLNASSITC